MILPERMHVAAHARWRGPSTISAPVRAGRDACAPCFHHCRPTRKSKGNSICGRTSRAALV
ncbi:ABC-type multidrug transport system, ATPase and permease components [Burkholderia pseudomallei 305]|nr:ABC-type multidrug transport system, ATPase and permease components [Burkholderia pseudomallei 305]EDO90767.1 putative MotB [Burkholderia pseudomallei Pasteur 52237]